MTESIHVRARKFLQQFFNDEDLTNFCFDYFPQVYNDFTTGMPKSQKVRMLVDSSQRRDRFDELLAALERERPKSYPDYFSEQPHLIAPETQPTKTIERNPRQIFVSHAHQDAEFAQRLAADLRASGWQTWMAPDNIRPGEKWVEAINRGLSESGVFVLLLTPDAVDSRWVTSEMNVAIGMEHREEIRLLPLNLKSASTPALWQAYQWIGFDENYDAGLMALLNVLDLRNVTSIEPVKTKLPSEQKSQVESKEEVASTPQRTFNERINTVPTYWFYVGGGFILLLILLVSFWPEQTKDSVDVPTEMAEVSVATTEETNTLQSSPSETPTVSTPTVKPAEATTQTPFSTPTNGSDTPPFNEEGGSSWIRPLDRAEMVFVPADSFMMGSDPEIDADSESDEIPLHEVRLDGFWIDRTEVTNVQYAEFLNVHGNLGEGGVTWLDIEDEDVLIELKNGVYVSKPDFGNYPAIEISWYGANSYCQWVGGSLPTEAEWEYAARGPDGHLFPWGETIDIVRANFCDNNCSLEWADTILDDGFAEVAPVGTYSPGGDSWVGAADMAGNVWEWVSDWYDRNYYSEEPEYNPPGPESGNFKVMRGGGWNPDISNLRGSNRDVNLPDVRSDFIGFRCVISEN